MIVVIRQFDRSSLKAQQKYIYNVTVVVVCNDDWRMLLLDGWIVHLCARAAVLRCAWFLVSRAALARVPVVPYLETRLNCVDGATQVL
jgi:hypothetical protein